MNTSLAKTLDPCLVDTIRDRLNRAGSEWSFATIARIGGISTTWVSEFSRGHYPNPGIRSLHKLVSALDQLEGSAE